MQYNHLSIYSEEYQTMFMKLMDGYGFEILNAYLNTNCFKTKLCIKSSLKFLKYTEWAWYKVEKQSRQRSPKT